MACEGSPGGVQHSSLVPYLRSDPLIASKSPRLVWCADRLIWAASRALSETTGRIANDILARRASRAAFGECCERE